MSQKTDKAGAFFSELNKVLRYPAFSSVRSAVRHKGAHEEEEMIEVGIDGTITNEDIEAIKKLCQEKGIAFWGFAGWAGERGYMFFNLFHYKPTN